MVLGEVSPFRMYIYILKLLTFYMNQLWYITCYLLKKIHPSVFKNRTINLYLFQFSHNAIYSSF